MNEIPGPFTLVRSSSAPPSLPSPAAAEPPDTISLRNFFHTLLRWKMFIAVFTGCAIALGYLVIHALTPRYTAEAAILIDTDQVKVANIETGDGSQEKGNAFVRSQLDIIRSRSLTQQVVKALSLDDDEEFNPYVRAPSLSLGDWLAQETVLHSPTALLRRLPAGWRGWLTEPPASLRVPAPEQQRSEVVTNVLKQLTASNDDKSYTIDLSFVSTSPRKAAAILNKFAQLYLVSQLDAKYQATDRVAHWLESKRVDLRKQVEDAEAAVQAYKAKYGITDLPNNATVATEQITSVTHDLMQARAAHAQVDAQLRETQLLAKSPTGVTDSPQAAMSPLIQTLRDQLIAAQRRYAELTAAYGPKYPTVIRSEAEVNEARMRLQQEVDRIASNLKGEVQIERAREQSLDMQLKQLEATNQDRNRALAGLKYLESEASAARTVLQSFVTGMVTTSAESAYQASDARLLSPAEVPVRPSFPPHLLLLALFAASGLMLSLGVVATVEALDDKLRAADEAEGFLGVPVLGSVPTIKSLKKNMDPSSYALQEPFSLYSEAVRSVHVALRASNVDSPPKIVLITSSLPSDGKTSLAATLARLAAAMGKRVLLVDCDLRHPSIGTVLEAGKQRGLFEILLGEESLDHTVQHDARSGMYFLTAGRTSMAKKFPVELLQSQRMAELARSAASQYDLVLFDCPPVGLVHDPLVLAELADAVLLIVRWGVTRKAVAAAAVKKFIAARRPVTGAVITQVNVHMHAKYGYADSSAVYAKKYLSGVT